MNVSYTSDVTLHDNAYNDTVLHMTGHLTWKNSSIVVEGACISVNVNLFKKGLGWGQCAISTARWRGVRVSDLLAAHGIDLKRKKTDLIF